MRISNEEFDELLRSEPDYRRRMEIHLTTQIPNSNRRCWLEEIGPEGALVTSISSQHVPYQIEYRFLHMNWEMEQNEIERKEGR